jgi:hypothetical protein
VSGDHNPIHLDRAYAATTTFGRPIAHGMLVASMFSTVFASNSKSLSLSSSLVSRACCLLAGWLAGCWLPAAGCRRCHRYYCDWLLAAGCWLLAARCWLDFCHCRCRLLVTGWAGCCWLGWLLLALVLLLAGTQIVYVPP